LATLAAYDFGYIDRLELVVRLRNTLDSLGELPRHRGHLLNWYDTTTLAPLEPRYVSTVDSGNLALTLLGLEQGCRELARGGRPLTGRLCGLCDSLDVLGQLVEPWGEAAGATLARIEAMHHTLDAAAGPFEWLACLADLAEVGLVALEAELL